jgi:hypothetical protein
MGALLSTLASGMSAERRSSGKIDDEQATGLILAQLTRDVRGAADLAPATQPPDELDLVEVDGSRVRWVYDGGQRRLTRYLGANAGISLGSVGDATAFTLLGAGGQPLLAGAGYTPADLIHCAATIQATVTLSDGVSETAAAGLAEVPQDAGGSAVTGVRPAGGWPGCP